MSYKRKFFYKLEFNEPNLTGAIAQPSNSITSLFYVIIGVLLHRDLVILLLCIILGLTSFWFHAKDTLTTQWIDILSIVILVLALLYKGFPFNDLNLKPFIIGMVLFGIAWIFWIIDIKKMKFLPKNHILTGHGVWHALTAAAIWFAYQSLPLR